MEIKENLEMIKSSINKMQFAYECMERTLSEQCDDVGTHYKLIREDMKNYHIILNNTTNWKDLCDFLKKYEYILPLYKREIQEMYFDDVQDGGNSNGSLQQYWEYLLANFSYKSKNNKDVENINYLYDKKYIEDKTFFAYKGEQGDDILLTDWQIDDIDHIHITIETLNETILQQYSCKIIVEYNE